MLCALSGELPQDPVISTKSGNVFERRLIEKYITENGKDPITEEELAVDDLVSLKTSHIPRPTPPTLTSIPALLFTFQNEWDSFALEAFKLRKELGQTRMELSTALYQHDAAVRVIARLTRERDEARDALSKVTVTGGASAESNGDAMQIDSQGLPQDLVEKVEQVRATLSKSRKKRPVPATWATVEQIQEYTAIQSSEPTYPGAKFISLNKSGDVALVGGADGLAGIFSIADNKLVEPIVVGDGAITSGVFYGAQPVFATSTGAVKVFDGNKPTAVFTKHAGACRGLALHPSGDILASVGVDKSFVIYDLAQSKAVAQIYTDFDLNTVAWHPDGHLLGLASPGQISLYHTDTLAFAASFSVPSTSPITSLTFSENGIWFAASTSNSVIVFDVRKEGEAAILKTFESSAEVRDLAFDYTGQYLAFVGKGGVEVKAYRKKEKVWVDGLQVAVPGEGLVWGPEAAKVVTVNESGVVSVLSGSA